MSKKSSKFAADLIWINRVERIDTHKETWIRYVIFVLLRI